MDDVPRILVADDEVKICSLLKKLLEREGYRVTTVNDGATLLLNGFGGAVDIGAEDVTIFGDGFNGQAEAHRQFC